MSSPDVVKPECYLKPIHQVFPGMILCWDTKRNRRVVYAEEELRRVESGDTSIKPGYKYGHLTVIREVHRIPRLYLCRCSCGDYIICERMKLLSGYTRSCGCRTGEYSQTGKSASLIGMRFGNLVVVARTTSVQRKWICVCDCGGKIYVNTSQLVRGEITHCNNCHGGVVTGGNTQ